MRHRRRTTQDELVRPDGTLYNKHKDYGEMPEWSNGAVLKTARVNSPRGFESLSLRSSFEMHLSRCMAKLLVES